MSAQQWANSAANFIFLGIVVAIPLIGQFKKVKVYESFIDGAKEGFQLTITMVPYLVAMLVAIGMLRASGAFAALAHVLGPALKHLGVPTDILPLALVRPFSGSAANGVLADIIHTHGGNAYVSHLAATIMGGTETTFYVVAVYFGAVGIQRTRHAVPAGLFADFIGVVAAILVCHFLIR